MRETHLILGVVRLEIGQWCEMLQSDTSKSADVYLAATGVGLYIENNRGVFFGVWHLSLVCFGPNSAGNAEYS